MKEYLLKPWKRVSILQQHGEVFAVPAKFGLRGLSWLVLDHYYLFVHFTYDHRTLLRTFFSKEEVVDEPMIISFIEASDVQLQMGVRRHVNCSVQTLLKQYGLEDLAK